MSKIYLYLDRTGAKPTTGVACHVHVLPVLCRSDPLCTWTEAYTILCLIYLYYICKGNQGVASHTYILSDRYSGVEGD